MDNLKKFTVTLERRETTVGHVSVEIEADSVEDARILAKYKAIQAWAWNRKANEEVTTEVMSITETNGVNHSAELAPAYRVEPLPAHTLEDPL